MAVAWATEADTLAHTIHRSLFLHSTTLRFGHYDGVTEDLETGNIGINWTHNTSDVYHACLSLSLLFSRFFKEEGEGEKFVGICARNRVEWIETDLALAMSGVPSVGLHAHWPKEKLSFIANQTQMFGLVMDGSSECLLSSLSDFPHLRVVVLMPNTPTPSPLPPHIHLVEWSEIVSAPSSSSSPTSSTPLTASFFDSNPSLSSSLFTSTSSVPTPNSFSYGYVSPQKIFSLMYTSGTTGKPKGVVVNVERWKNDIKQGPFKGQVDPTILSHLSLAHGADRGLCWQAIIAGVPIVFAQEHDPNEPLELRDSIQGVQDDHEFFMAQVKATRPTFFLGMAHFWTTCFQRFHLRMEEAVEEKWPETQNWRHKGVVNARNYAEKIARKSGLYEDMLEEERMRFGGRLLTQVTGGSVTSEEVLQWMGEVFSPKTGSGGSQGSRAQDAYGTTEFPGISIDGEIVPSVQLRLEDVPGRYTAADKPYPRGQILVRHKMGKEFVSGYFQCPDDTKDSFTEDGWYKTGDIGQLNHDKPAEDGRPTLKIIDRLKNLLEIYVDGDSEWINPAPLEAFYGSVSQIFQNQFILLSDRNEDCMVGVCVPNPGVTEFDLMVQFRSIADLHNLSDSEIPGGVVLLDEPWTTDSGLLTPLGKPVRSELAAKFKAKIDLKYVEIHDRALADSENSKLGDPCGRHGSASDLVRLSHDGEEGGLEDEAEFVVLNKGAEELFEKIMNSFDVPNVPQNIKCDDFINFKFTDDSLNEILSQMIPFVKQIRENSHLWGQQKSEENASVLAELYETIRASEQDLLVEAEKFLFNPAPTSEDLSAFISHIGARKSKTVRASHEVSQVLSKPHPEHAYVLDRYTPLLDRLMSLAPRLGIRVPYQIWACGWWREPGREYKGGDDPTLLSAPLGTAEVYCQLTGEIIERDEKDTGTKRMHNLNRSEIDRTTIAHNIVQKINEKVKGNKELTEKWEIVDVFQDDIWCSETSHQWHHRVNIDKMDGKIDNPATIFGRIVTEYCNRPFLGMPSRTVFPDLLYSPLFNALKEEEVLNFDNFNWITYGAAGRVAKLIAKKIVSLSSVPPLLSSSPDALSAPHPPPVSICGFNTTEWMLVDFACALSGYTSVGLHTTLPPSTTTHLLSLISSEILFCVTDVIEGTGVTSWKIDDILGKEGEEKGVGVKNVVVMDGEVKEEWREKWGGKVKFFSILEWLKEEEGEKGEEGGLPDPSLLWPEGSTQPFTLLFTSGTSAYPKGVMVSVQGFLNDISERVFVEPLVTASYIPLSHSSDRLKTWEFSCNGGRVGLVHYAPTNWIEHEQDKKKNAALSTVNSGENIIGLFRQVKYLQPSAMSCPPRIWNGLYALFKERRAAQPDRPVEEIENEIFSFFGERMMFLVTGGAPTAPKIKKFAQRLSDRHSVKFMDSYGATECGAITSDGFPVHKYGDKYWVQIRLDPVESLNLKGGTSAGDLGEICVKTQSLSMGYYKDEQNTKANYLEGGWYRTGDLGKYSHGKKLKVLGRLSSAVLLENGEVLCPGALEAFLVSESGLVNQAFVDYHSGKIKIVVTLSLPPSSPLSSLPDEELREKIRAEWKKADEGGDQTKLLPKNEEDFVLERGVWSLENGLLTAQLKEARGLLRKKYFEK